MHDAERANNNNDGSPSGLGEVLDYARDTLGCAAVRYLTSEAVGFFSLTPRGVVSRWDDARDGAEILRRALGVTQLESACLVANASAKAHGETADGLVVALGVDEQQTARLGTQLQRLAPLVARAFLDDEAEEQRREEQLGQRLIIDLCRDIQDERLDEPSNDANIFEKGARHVCELFASSSCVILDVSDLRLFRGGGGGTASKTSSNTRSARSRMSTASTSVVDPSSSAGSLPTSPLTEQNGGDGRRPQHRRSRSSQELLSTMAMERQLDRTTDALIEMQEDDDEAETDGAAEGDEGDDAMDDILSSSPSDDLLTFESFVPAPSSQVVCSFPTTGGAVAVLGSHGPDAQALVSMPGDRVRPALARYLAASRNSGRDSRAYIEVGPFDGEGGDDFDAPSSLRKMLGLGEDRGLMCAAIMEADSQPASVVVVLLADGFDPRPYHGIFLEQVGACLIYSVVRARAEERDVAQSHFIQRVQHELRTPVHAILGVNETARYALGHSLEQAAAAGEGAAVSVALREELCELVDSVALSADKLSTIVDDLVDFSLMVEGKKPSLVMGSEQVKAAAQGPTSVTTITWDTVCAVISSTVNQAWSLFRRECMSRRPSLSPPPLPELIFSTNYLHQDPLEWSVADVRMDLEVVKRVAWKLVLNAMQATETGLISVAVHRRALKIDSPSTVQKLELIVSDTGRGMARDFVDSRLFQPFAKERAESDGVGLSLSVCRSLVAQQGGRIYAQSTEGQGSKFIVSIPFTPRLFDGSKSNKDAWSKRRGSDSASTGSTPSSHSSSAKVHFADFDSYSLALLRDRLVSQFGLRNHVTDDLGSANIIVLADVKPEAVRRRIIEGRQTIAVSPVRVVYMPLAYQDVSAEDQGFLDQLRAACGGSGDDGGLGNVHVLPRPLTFAHLRRFDAICHASVSPSPRLTAVKEVTDARHHPALKKPRVAYSSSSSSSSSMPPSSSSSSARSLLVLVVEDNPLNAKILTTLLRRAGLEYIEAKDGRQAVDLFERHRPRVVLLDINMPIMNGFEACQAMRRLQEAWGRPNEAHTIIAVTALSSEADKLRGQEAGVDEWHTKPLRLSGLVAKLQRWRDSEAHVAADRWPSPPPALVPLSPRGKRGEVPLSPL